jgi:hypothetical protein
MIQRNSMAAIKDVLGFPFRDINWRVKFLLGSGLIFVGTFIPLLPWLPVMGYGARILRRAAGGSPAGTTESATLPEWDDWNGLFIDGLHQFGVSFIFSLPLIFVIAVGYGLYFLSFITMAVEGGEPGVFFIFSFTILWISIGLSLIISLLTMLLMAPAQAHVAVRKDFLAFARFSEWGGILRANLSSFLVVLFILLGLYTLIMFAMQIIYMTVVLCCLLPVLLMPIMFYAMVVYYHSAGLAYGEGMEFTADTPSAAADMAAGF